MRRSILAARKNALLYYTQAESCPPGTIISGGGVTFSAATGGVMSFVGTGFRKMRRALLGVLALAFAVTDDEHMTVTIPAGVAGGHYYLSIETRGGQVYPFPDVNIVPEVASVSPPTGPATGGTAITITGNGFLGTDILYMYDGTGFVSLPFVIVNNTTITATTPDHTPIGPTAFVTFYAYNSITGGYASPSFTFVASALTFVSCTPSNGPSGGVTPVAIVGTGFYGVVDIEVEPSISSIAFTIVNDSLITCDIDGPALFANPGDPIDFRIIRVLATDEIMAVAAFTFDP